MAATAAAFSVCPGHATILAAPNSHVDKGSQPLQLDDEEMGLGKGHTPEVNTANAAMLSGAEVERQGEGGGVHNHMFKTDPMNITAAAAAAPVAGVRTSGTQHNRLDTKPFPFGGKVLPPQPRRQMSVDSWTTRTITDTAYGVRSVFAVDIDGDGNIDLLSAMHSNDAIAWYENFLERVSGINFGGTRDGAGGAGIGEDAGDGGD